MKDLLYFRERERLGRILYNKDTLIKRMGLLKSDHHIGFEPDYIGVSPVYCSKYSPSSNSRDVLALANEEGILAIQKTSSRNSSILVKQVHRNAIFDVAWMENEEKLTTVSGDQTAVLWDVKQSDICKIATFVGHTGSVKTTVFRPNQNDIFATGARDGKINIWDVRISHNCPASKPDNCSYDGPNSGKRKKNCNILPNSIISMVFQDENTLISCGAVDGIIKAWDLRKNYAVYKRVPLPKCRLPEKGPGSQNGFTCLSLDPSNTRLFANCMDSSVYSFNVATFDSKPVSVYRGHSIHSFYVKSCLSVDGKYLLSGSSDGRAFIWDTTIAQKYPVAILEGHAGEVTSVTWNSSVEPEVRLDNVRFCIHTSLKYWLIMKCQLLNGQFIVFSIIMCYKNISQNDPRFDARLVKGIPYIESIVKINSRRLIIFSKENKKRAKKFTLP
ncbi:hypothetical protein J437_LFUL007017 [Ladona fulva]|uniref:Uncharacterized protein n=1 Tax=Ladona fulva TaxID=123851 RepID=A0A8K0K6A3_LADFU|nr:hypothetical protein J437_LFUL007017 [Ladona fulva]